MKSALKKIIKGKIFVNEVLCNHTWEQTIPRRQDYKKNRKCQ